LLQDRSGSLTVQQLGDFSRQFLEAGRKRPELANLFTSFDPRYPQVKVDLDREKARKLGVPINEVFQALSATMGGSYVNDFNRFGRLFRVYVQADAAYRRKPKDIGDVYVRSRSTNSMIPLSTLVTITSEGGTEITNRFNLFRSVEINGVPGRGYTSGQALAALEDVFKQTMPKELGFAYSSLSYQEKVAPPAGPTFVLAIVFVFLLLAAMYESWRLPWAVLLGSPLVALGSFFGVWLMGYDNNVYVQIGNIMLIGLAAKNAILIVEFAKAKHEIDGMGIAEAALESARLRFRPILMTAFAFILGVVPLMKASGAESLSVAASVFMGQTEAPLTIRPFLNKMTQSELMCIMTAGMAHVSGGIMGAYIAFGIEAKHLLAAVIMTAPGTILLAKLFVPETEQPVTSGAVKIDMPRTDVNVIGAAARGTTEGLHLALNVAAMLVAFLSIVALLNAILGTVGLKLETILGWVFAPLALAMGVPWSEALVVGDLLGTRMVLNELIAYSRLGAIKAALEPRTFTIATYALCGFANFGSIGIQIGGIGALAPERRHDLARLGLRALLAGTLANFMTACIAGALL